MDNFATEYIQDMILAKERDNKENKDRLSRYKDTIDRQELEIEQCDRELQNLREALTILSI